MVPPGTLKYFFSVGYSNEIQKGAQKEVRILLDPGMPVIENGRQRI